MHGSLISPSRKICGGDLHAPSRLRQSERRTAGINPKFWNARFNLAEIPFLKRDWAEARNRFQDLLSSNAIELQGKQLIRFKIFLTYLLGGKEAMADSILADMRIPDGTPASYYADAAIALHNKDTEKANFCIAAAEKNFSPQSNKLFAESFYEIGWLKQAAR